MKPRTKKILKWTGIVFGSLILIAIAFGLYVNSIIPKFDSKPVVLQKELFQKPTQLFPMEGKFIYKSASELAIMIRSGQATSVEIVTEFINNIKNNNYKYNALIYLREKEALDDARNANEAITKGDTFNKPLLGVPLTIKEMFWVKGSPSTLNAKMYGFTAPRNAEVVNHLKNAGAIILGTTNDAYLLSDYQTQGEVYPICNNPFDTTRTPGGSTGGGAAALAAGFTTLELGSDLGGSIRVPSVFCGLWSLKPTFGAVNISDGTSPDSAFVYTRMALASAGPMARTPDDLKLIWEVLRSTKIDIRFQKPIDWKPSSDKSLNQYKIAWMDEWKLKDGNVKISNDTKEKFNTFIDSLKGNSVVIEKNAPEIYTDLQKMFLSTFGYMMGENQPWLLRKFIEMDFAKTDNGSGNFNSFSDAIMDASDEGWNKIQADRNILINKWENFFTQYDFFICPVTYGAAFKKGESWKPIKTDDGKSIGYMDYVPYSYVINATGHPAITVPLGLNAQGLPIGIQIVGRYYSEPELLHLAKLLEPLTPKFQKPN
ncbi:MAG: amidase family protein [Saprospiraceae bacterium]